jgi:hypothetical protein
MAKITKQFDEIELLSGKVVNLSITVTGEHETNHGADAAGAKGMGIWLKESWSHKVDCDDELEDADLEEISDKVEELVQSESWDFDDAEQEIEFENEYD